MDDKKQEGTTDVSVDTTSSDASTTLNPVEEVSNEVALPVDDKVAVADANETTSATSEVSSSDKVPAHSAFNARIYVGAVAVILVIGAGLLFVLEKEGRISTGLFSGVISKMEASAPAAEVNNVEISKQEFNSSVQQLTQMAAAQGADTSNPEILKEFQSQAIDTLVNAELLRQAAVKEGLKATPEEIETRFSEIREGIGGAESLSAKMAEFGVTEASLRRDIENEFLIQGLFNMKIATSTIEVSETEISTFYTNAGGADAGLPPLQDVREQISAQIRFEKEQALIKTYLDSLKEGAEIKILI